MNLYSQNFSALGSRRRKQETRGKGANEAKSKVRRRELIRLGWPLIGVNVSIVGVQLGDAWIAANLGTPALASIASSGLFLLALASFGQGVSLPLIGDIAAKWDQGEGPVCVSILKTSLLLLPVLGIGCAIAAVLTAKTLFALFSHPIDIFEQEVMYFKIGALAMIVKFGSYAWASYFIGTKQTRVVLMAALVTVCANFCVSYSLVHGIGPLPNLGFMGLPMGTFIASCIEFVIFSFVYFRTQALVKDRFSRITPIDWSRKAFARQLGKGLPAGVHAAIDVLAWGAILMWMVGRFGNEHHAAAAILIRLMLFSFLPSEGIATALISRIGTLHTHSWKSADLYASAAFKLIGTYMVSCSVLFMALRPLIATMFTADAEVARIVSDCLFVVCLFQFFDAMNITYGNALLGVGDTLWPALINSLLVIIILVVGGLTVIRYFPELQSLGIWILVALYVTHQGLLFRNRWARKALLQISQVTTRHPNVHSWTPIALKS